MTQQTKQYLLGTTVGSLMFCVVPPGVSFLLWLLWLLTISGAGALLSERIEQVPKPPDFKEKT